MFSKKKELTTGRIIELALSMGASLVGTAEYEYGSADVPKKGGTVLVLALEHKETEPELDWWDGKGGTKGNRILRKISKKLKSQLKEEFNVNAYPLAYHVEKGGIFLKDAAVLAGIGIIGKNNLLITPQLGARVRLRALFLDFKSISTEPLDFEPCKGCEMLCWKACPENAFKNGSYNRELCDKQMYKNESEKVIIKEGIDNKKEKVCVKYCRACELSCPFGNKS